MPKAVMNSVLFSIIFEIVIIFWKLGEGGGVHVYICKSFLIYGCPSPKI